MNSARRLTRIALGTWLVSALVAQVPAAPQGTPLYHVTDLRNAVEATWPGVTWPGSRARGLNQDGDLVGEAELDGAQQQAFLYTVEHGIIPLPLIAGWSSNLALEVSDRDQNGEVVIVGGGVYGVHWDVFIGEAALWRVSTVTGTVLETRKLGTPAGLDDALAMAVNNNGKVVGWGHATSNSFVTPWKYDVNTQVLETFPFPSKPMDINNSDQVCGGPYRGDLFGNYQHLGNPPEIGEPGYTKINDQGWVMGRAGTGISDGAGHFLATVVRFADGLGWTVMPPVSHLTLAGGLNGQGDFTSAGGSVFLQSTGQFHAIGPLIAPEFHNYSAGLIPAINDHQQVVATMAHAILLTPLGVMVIPGDVNGDVRVDLDDLCAFNANPIDLDGDGSVTGADLSWLIARLAVFGHAPTDCNANGVPDRCDITSGTSSDCDLDGVPDSCQSDCNSDGIPDSCEPDCNGNGTPDPCDVLAGTSEDCNVNGVPDECDGGWTVDYANVFDPPVFVPVNAFLPDDIVVNESGLVGDVDFTIDIGYRIGHLTVLLSHNGKTITLIERPGHPESFLGNGQSGYDIILDDEGTGGPIEDEGNFGSPFGPILSPPSFTPNEALSAFDGMPMAGTWTITVITDPVYSSVTEEWTDWGLTITSAPESIPPCVCQTLVSNYCSSSSNSTGAAAVISSNLECSVVDNQLELVASPVPNSTGLFFYGPSQASVPFGNGVRCVAAGGLGLFRLPAQVATNNTLSHSLDLSNPPQASGAITPASTWYFQAWYRDVAAGGAQFDTSDGLRINFIP